MDVKKKSIYILTLFIIFTLISCGKKREAQLISNFPDVKVMKFPAGFLWGTSTAAEQMEETPDSDWGKFIQEAYKSKHFDTAGVGLAKPGHIHNLGNYNSEQIIKKTNHNTMYNQDFEMAKNMKHNAYRFSIAWDRIFPKADMKEPDKDAIIYYKNLIKSMKANGLYPLLTLFHFSSPAWLWEEKNGKIGWEREDALLEYEKFVRVVTENFGTEIDHWCTLNEPMVFILGGYMEGVFPPLLRRKEIKEIIPVMSTLLKVHALSRKIILESDAKLGKKSIIGFTMHTRAFEPYRNYAPLDRIIASQIEQAFIWDFIDATKTGILKVTSTDYKEEIPGLKDSLDYLGINYYGRYYIKSNIFAPTKFETLFSDPNSKKEIVNDLGWEAYPLGFSYILSTAYEKYKLPIYILESGTADGEENDVRRQANIVTHTAEIWNLLENKKADIRGYIHWSLMDNFEWAEGFEAKFGLVKVDYHKNYKRTPRPSAKLYTEIIENGISKEMIDLYSKDYK
jgi:beta-glucosidase